MCTTKLILQPAILFVLTLLYLPHISAEKVKLDTILWQSYNSNKGAYTTTEREVYAYNNDGQIISSEFSRWSMLQKVWLKSDKTRFIYSNTMLMEEITSFYEATTSSWKDSLKYSYIYDNKGNITEFTSYEKGATLDVWLPVSKEENQYDVSGNLIKSIFSLKYVALGDWYLASKDSMIYDDNNDIIEFVGLAYDEIINEWVNYEREVYAYNNENNAIDYRYFLWDEYTSTWSNYYKDYSADIDDNNTGFISYYWDETTNEWIQLTKEYHEFDSNENVILFDEYEWNINKDQWDFYDKETYLYDAFNNMTEFVDYNKDATYNIWVEAAKEVYAYDTTVPITDVYHPFDDNTFGGVVINNRLKAIEAFTWGASKWNESEKAIFSYENVPIVGFDNLNESEGLQLFPNPTSDKLFFTASIDVAHAYNLYNLQGQRVQNGAVMNNAIDISNLAEGIYLLMVTKNNIVVLSQKVVKL